MVFLSPTMPMLPMKMMKKSNINRPREEPRPTSQSVREKEEIVGIENSVRIKDGYNSYKKSQ